MFRSLRVRNYRFYAGGQVISLTGTWMQRVAQDWLILELSGNSGAAIGFVLALQFGPTLLFSMFGGLLADRYDKRRILFATQSIMIVQAAVLGLLDVTGAVQLWHVYLLARARHHQRDRRAGAAVVRGRDGRRTRTCPTRSA
jgi:MFS family permease